MSKQSARHSGAGQQAKDHFEGGDGGETFTFVDANVDGSSSSSSSREGTRLQEKRKRLKEAQDLKAALDQQIRERQEAEDREEPAEPTISADELALDEEIRVLEDQNQEVQAALAAAPKVGGSDHLSSVGAEAKANASKKYIFDTDLFGLWVYNAATAGAHLRTSIFCRRMCSSRFRAVALMGGEGIIVEAETIYNNLAANSYVAQSGLQGDLEGNDWPPAVDFDFLASLDISSSVAKYESFLKGYAVYLKLFMVKGVELNRNSLESVLSGTQALARTYRTQFGSHWHRCLDDTEDYLRNQEASYSVPFLVHTFDNALAKFNQLARDEYRKVDSTYPDDLKTPGNVVKLFKAVFKKMQSAVTHGAADRFNAAITVHPGAKKFFGLGSTPAQKRLKANTFAPDDLYCTTYLQHVLGVPGGKECTNDPCHRHHPQLEDATQKIARASLSHLDTAARKELIVAIEKQLAI